MYTAPMQLTLRVLAATVFALGTAACGNTATAPSALPGDVTVLTVGAHIDGRSHLMLSGNTAQWHHLEGIAPSISTTINGIEWVPTWPGDSGNLDCDCLSSVFSGVAPPLPSTLAEVSLLRAEIPGFPNSGTTVSVVQSPDAANEFTTVVEFDDSQRTGDRPYEVEIRLNPREG